MDTVEDTMVENDVKFGRHEFLNTRPEHAIPCVVIIAIASIVGTCGNIMILAVVASKKKLRNVESIFIANLAISDLYVTTIADPMSLVGTYELFMLIYTNRL